MRRAVGRLFLGLALLPPLAALAAAPPALRIDPAASQLAFEVRTRLGQRLEGVFPVYEGTVETLADGRHQVRLRVATGAAAIPDKPRYTAWMRGDSFFDAERHPWMEFVSEPYPAGALAEGGELQGRLSLRGVTREQRLALAPAACPRPGLDCAVWVSGEISRHDYGMDQWRLVLGDRVLLRMQVRLKDNAVP